MPLATNGFNVPAVITLSVLEQIKLAKPVAVTLRPVLHRAHNESLVS